MFYRAICTCSLSLILVSVSFADEASDFNSDSAWNTLDIDALVQVIVAGTNDAGFDLTNDGVVNVADRDAWLALSAGANGFGSPYLLGDLNLDGRVDVLGDAFTLISNLLSDNARWSAGDLTADGSIDVLGDAFLLILSLIHI